MHQVQVGIKTRATAQAALGKLALTVCYRGGEALEHKPSGKWLASLLLFKRGEKPVERGENNDVGLNKLRSP